MELGWSQMTGMREFVRDSAAYRWLKQSRLWQPISTARKYYREHVRYGNLSANANTERYWDAKLERQGERWRDENYHHVLEFIPEDRTLSLLDIGCALGDGCELIKRERPMVNVTGADFSSLGIDRARRKAREADQDIEYLLMNILRDPIPSQFDIITVVETLEHFDSPFRVVDKCLRAAREKMIVSVPYSDEGSGPVGGLGEHRFRFNEETFAEYDQERPPKITDFVEATSSRCIVYVLSAHQST